MSTHLTILLWLGIIFVVAASIILGLLLKSKKEERKESYLGFTVIFTDICTNIWYFINRV